MGYKQVKDRQFEGMFGRDGFGNLTVHLAVDYRESIYPKHHSKTHVRDGAGRILCGLRSIYYDADPEALVAQVLDDDRYLCERCRAILMRMSPERVW